jgi:hypothetical protein
VSNFRNLPLDPATGRPQEYRVFMEVGSPQYNQQVDTLKLQASKLIQI